MSSVAIKLAGVLQIDNKTLREQFNRKPFEVGHSLAADPRFTLERLIDVTRELAKIKTTERNITYNVGDAKVSNRWKDLSNQDIPVTEAVEHIQQAGAWILLRRLERLPEYRALLDGFITEISERVGCDFRKEMQSDEIICFITSPNRTTPYHIDRECSFIFQIQGEKTIHVFDRDDRDIVPDKELEDYWTLGNNSAVYKPEFQGRSLEVRLRPGVAVHVPINCPHWLQNADNVSVTVNMNFIYPATVRANLYRANYYMRKLGITPSPVGKNPSADELKRRMFNSAVRMSRLFKSGPRESA
jgi:hypothetical protein